MDLYEANSYPVALDDVTQTLVFQIKRAMSVYLAMLWSKLCLVIFILLTFPSLCDICFPYIFPHLQNFVVMEICENLEHNFCYSCRKCKQQHHLYEIQQVHYVSVFDLHTQINSSYK